MSYLTAYKKAHGVGAAHEGTHHFWLQRVTAVALIPLGLLFVWPFAAALGEGAEAARAVYRNGWNAFIAINFFVLGFWHLKLGVQVVIEDYVHARGRRLRMLIANMFFCWGVGLAAVMAVVKIWLGA